MHFQFGWVCFCGAMCTTSRQLWCFVGQSCIHATRGRRPLGGQGAVPAMDVQSWCQCLLGCGKAQVGSWVSSAHACPLAGDARALQVTGLHGLDEWWWSAAACRGMHCRRMHCGCHGSSHNALGESVLHQLGLLRARKTPCGVLRAVVRAAFVGFTSIQGLAEGGDADGLTSRLRAE